jgi:hypothetical protein
MKQALRNEARPHFGPCLSGTCSSLFPSILNVTTVAASTRRMLPRIGHRAVSRQKMIIERANGGRGTCQERHSRADDTVKNRSSTSKTGAIFLGNAQTKCSRVTESRRNVFFPFCTVLRPHSAILTKRPHWRNSPLCNFPIICLDPCFAQT